MVSLRHGYTATGTNNPDKQVSVDRWNAEHSLTGTTGKIVGFDASGQATELDFSPASTSAGAGFRVPPGVAPSAPVNGDLWTTAAGAFWRINGVTRTVGFFDGATSLALGTLPSGSTNSLDLSRTATGDSGGTTQWYGIVHRIYAQGANAFDFVRESYAGTHAQGAGVVANLEGRHQYIWGENGSNTTAGKVISAHVRFDTGATVTGEIDYFRAVSITLGTVSISQVVGFSAGALGTANVTNVYGVDIADQTTGSVAIAFRSAMSSGTNKYAFYGGGTAQSAFGGFVTINAASAPVYPLDVRATWNNFSADISNSHASSPSGLRVRYTGAAPNNSTNEFIICSDTGATRFSVASSGVVATTGVTCSGAITASGGTGIGYATGAGGTVTQATNKTTGVTINKLCGQITMNNAALGAGATASFLVTNSLAVSTDSILLTIAGGKASNATYECWVDGTGGGAFWITVKNISAGSLSEALIINFAILKSVTS